MIARHISRNPALPDEEYREQESKKTWLKYISIPVEILAHPDLSLTDGCVFGLIYVQSQSNRGCFAKNSTMARKLGISLKTFKESISRLISTEFIYTNEKSNHLRRIYCSESYISKNSRNLVKWYADCDEEDRQSKKVTSYESKKVTTEEYSINIGSKEPIGASAPNGDIDHNLSEKNQPTKRRRTTPIPVEEKQPKLSPLVEFWNTLPGVRQIKNPATKVYASTAAALRQIMSGTFFEKKVLDAEWVRVNKIPSHYKTRVLDRKKMQALLIELSHLFLDGYYPEDKKWVNDSGLINLLYNPRSQKSQFLLAAVKGVPALKDTKQASTKPLNIHAAVIASNIAATLSEEGSILPDREGVEKIATAINSWSDDWDRDTHTYIPGGFGKIGQYTAEFLIETACTWPDFKLHYFKVGNKIWKAYVDYIQNNIMNGIDVLTGRRIG